jgi:hypothetical protein
LNAFRVRKLKRGGKFNNGIDFYSFLSIHKGDNIKALTKTGYSICFRIAAMSIFEITSVNVKTVLWTANQYKGDVCSVEIPSEFF